MDNNLQTKNSETESETKSDAEFQPYNLNTDENLSKIILSSNYEILDYNNNTCLITLLGNYFSNKNNNNNTNNTNTITITNKIIEKENDNINENKNEKINFILRIKKKEFEILNEEKSKDKAKDNNEDDVNVNSNSINQRYNNLLSTLINEIENTSNVVFNNDIYYKFISKASDNLLKVDFIFPADKKVIEKYQKKFFILFEENYETYLTKTLKYIDSIDPKHTKWISNALYENTEKILFSIPNEFIILQDYNSLDNKKTLNCLGISYEKIKTLRDLNESHLDLLKKLYNEGVNIILLYTYFISLILFYY